MTLKKCILTANDCYKKNQKMTGGKPTGIVVHSTGASNKTLKRYVQPLKGSADYDAILADIGKNQYANDWNRSGTSACVHAFIGVNAAGQVETYQTLPFDVCCWGVGSGSKGSYNYNPRARVQFEMCEDDLKDAAYFNAVMKEAQEFCAYLCKQYGLTVSQISSHKESHDAGYGSNHGDPENWLKPFGKTMDWFRAEVQKLLDAGGASTQPSQPATDGTLYYVQTGAYKEKANAEAQAAKMKAAGFDTYVKVVDGLYKVQTGDYKEKANADAQLAKVKAAGFDAFITTNGAGAAAPTPATPSKSVDEIAREVIDGKWGNGADRKARLEAAGYNYAEVQARVNEILGGSTGTSFSVGDKVKCNAGVKKFSNGVTMASWVPSATLYVRQVESNGKILLVSTEPTKQVYTGRVNASDVHKI